jgi:hypothetical protein
MNRMRQRRTTWLAWLAVSAWLFPTAGWTANDEPLRPETQPIIHDIRLDPQGTMHGRLLNLEGRPVIEETLELIREGETITQAMSDSDGRFQFSPVSTGIYQIQWKSSMVICRVWTDAVAPPVAKDKLVVLDVAPLVRGQRPAREIFHNPLFLGLFVAAAIAIPIAVHQSRSDRPPSS